MTEINLFTVITAIICFAESMNLWNGDWRLCWRRLAIACFYALGTALGGSIAPSIFGHLIETGSAWHVSLGYIVAAVLLLAAAAVEFKLGVDAEGRSLESIADPLSH
jgi:hypothetical protein